MFKTRMNDAMPEPENKSMTAEKYRQQTDSEADIHKAVVEWADRQAGANPELSLLFHPPNGGSRHGAEAKKLKEMGTRQGVPDLLLPVHHLLLHVDRGRAGAALVDDLHARPAATDVGPGRQLALARAQLVQDATRLVVRQARPLQHEAPAEGLIAHAGVRARPVLLIALDVLVALERGFHGRLEATVRRDVLIDFRGAFELHFGFFTGCLHLVFPCPRNGRARTEL